MVRDIVVWGMGGNGKNIVAVLESIGIRAIVDSNLEKIKKGEYKGIPTISPQEYFEYYTNSYLIISAMNYEGIVEKLEISGVKRFFVYAERKYSFYTCLGIKYNELEKTLNINRKLKYIIPYIDIVSIMMFDYLKAMGIDIKVKCNENSVIINQLMQDRMLDINDMAYDVEGYELLSPEVVNYKLEIEDKERIKRFKDIHNGEEVFIVATGPSLRAEDLERLKEKGCCCISMNSVYEVFSQTDWRPDYYVASDGLMVELLENKDYKKLEDITCFFSDNYIDCTRLRERKNSYFFNQKQDSSKIEFSDNFSDVVYAGKTVAYACLQLAAYMGFKRIYLLGVDHSFAKNRRRHFYKENKNDNLYKFYTYDKGFVEEAYSCARDHCSQNGCVIYNATRGGELDIFERVSFDDLF